MSNVPPPFSGSEGYRKKSNTGLIIMVIIAVLVGGCILLVGAAAFFGMNAFNSSIKPMIGCAVSFESIHGALRDYARDHGGKLPNAATWQDELRPYVKKSFDEARKEMEGAPDIMRVMNVDSDKWGCYTGSGDDMTGMAFNDAVSGKKVDDLESPMTTVIVFEVEKGEKNLHMPYRKQDEAKSPAIFGDHRGWFEVTWDDAEMISDGKRVEVNARPRRDRSRASSGESNEGAGSNSTSGAGESSGIGGSSSGN